MTDFFVALLYLAGAGALVLSFFPMSPLTLKFWMPPRHVMIFAFRRRRILWSFGALSLAIVGALAVAGVAWFGWSLVAVMTALAALVFWWGAYVPVVMGPPASQKVLSAHAVEGVLDPDEDVLGFRIGAEARAYPRAALTRPHVVHDVVSGIPVAVTYCILCNSGVAFRAEIDGRPIQLRPITAFNNNIIFYDADGDNLVQQIEGRVIDGPDAGKSLEVFPMTLTSWSAWRRLNPDTSVFTMEDTSGRDRLMGWMLRWMIPLSRLLGRRKPWHPLSDRLDSRLPAMELVIAAESGGERKAYPMSLLRERRIINDRIGGVPIVALYDPDLDTAAIYSRRLDDRDLTFEPVTPGKVQLGLASDVETGSTWDVMGRSRGGALGNRHLEPVHHFGKLFWFSWAAFRPDTQLATAADTPSWTTVASA